MSATKSKSVQAVGLIGGLALAGAVELLHRTRAAEQPKGGGAPTVAGKDQPVERGRGRPATTEEPAPGNAGAGLKVPKVLTPEEAIEQRPKEAVTVQFKVTAVQDETRSPGTGFGPPFIDLRGGGGFAVRLYPPATTTLLRLGVDPVKHFTGKAIRVTGLVQPHPSGQSFFILVKDFNQSEFAVVGN